MEGEVAGAVRAGGMEPEGLAVKAVDSGGGGALVRRRRRHLVARSVEVKTKFSDEEAAVLRAAAEAAGLTVAGFVASRAMAHARGEVSPLPSGTVEAMRGLMEARTLLRRYGTLLNQAVAKLNATGVADAGLGAAVERCDAATARVDGAAAHLARHR